MLHLPPQAKRVRTWAMIVLAIMVLLFNAGFPSTPAEAADSVKALNIEVSAIFPSYWTTKAIFGQPPSHHALTG